MRRCFAPSLWFRVCLLVSGLTFGFSLERRYLPRPGWGVKKKGETKAAEQSTAALQSKTLCFRLVSSVNNHLDRHGREAAVHHDVLAGNERRGTPRRQPDDSARQLVRLAEASHRRVSDDLATALGVTAVFLEQ